MALLAVWKAGGAYLVVTREEDSKRQHFMLEQAQPRIILTFEHLRAHLPAGNERCSAQVLCLDEAATCAAVASQPVTAPINQVTPETLAYVIYTSGTSSGVPKGVLATHAFLGALAEALIARFQVQPGDHLSQLLPLGFDASLSEILSAWLAGATLYPLPAGASTTGLVAFLQEHAISLAQIPPSLLPLLIDADLPALKTIVTGGDRAAPEVVQRLTAQGKRVINCYGLTETMICNVVEQITGQESFTYPLSYLGKPLPYVRVLIVNDAGQPLPAGEHGEIALFPTCIRYSRSGAKRPFVTIEKMLPLPPQMAFKQRATRNNFSFPATLIVKNVATLHLLW